MIAQSFSAHISQKVWQLMQDRGRADRLRSITLLEPFNPNMGEEFIFSQLSYARKYRNTASVEKSSHVDHVLKVISELTTAPLLE